MKGFQRLAGATLATAIALVGIGGLVRATASGEGCGPGEGDTWPLCVGGILPPLEYHALIEFSHRLVAGILVAMTLALAVWSYRKHRERKDLVRASLTSVGVVIVQALLGGIVVEQDTEKYLVAIHFGAAMVLVGVLAYLFLRTFDLSAEVEHRGDPSRFSMMTSGLVIATFVLLVVGAYVRGSDASLAFLDWPLMNSKLIPALGGPATAMFVHRLLALGTGILAIVVFMRSRAFAPRSVIRSLANLSVALMGAQILAGAANVLTKTTPWAMVLHVLLSALVWSTIVALATVADAVARQEIPAEAAGGADAPATSTRDQVAAYFQLMKPRIILLLLITTVPAMILAEAKMPSLWLILATLAGGTLAAGSANAINCYIDRDIDEIMRRTRKRPVPAHQLSPDQALAFGFAMGAIAFFFLAITVNVIAAGLAMCAIAFYVLVYTMWLKRSTEQNIVVGGAAGAVPALVGWAAVTGEVTMPAVMLFAIIFVWTPPHFWALALVYKDDYAAAKIPMMPVVRGLDATLNQILTYTLALFLVTLALVPIAGMGQIYLATAVILGGAFIWKAARLRSDYNKAAAKDLFKFSILYLALLFAAVAIDGLVGPPA